MSDIPVICLPPTFSGADDEYGILQFLLAADRCFKLNSVRLASPEIQVALIGSRLTGRAEKWFNFLEAKNHEALADLAKLKDLMKKHFANPNFEWQVCAKLVNIRQENEDVSDFTSKFLKLASEAGFDDKALRTLYFLALAAPIREHLLQLPALPSTFEETMRLSVDFATRPSLLFHDTPQENPPVSKHPSRNGPSSTPPTKQNARTEMDAIAARTARVEIKNHPHSAICSYCGRRGHVRDRCRIFLAE